MPLPRRHIPNALSILRFILAGIMLIPLSAVGAAEPDQARVLLLLAAACFIVAAVTDALDGYLARRWKVISAFGRVMDPAADKILILAAFIALAGPSFSAVAANGEVYQSSGVLPIVPILILLRELLVTSIRGVYESAGVDFSAGASGKIKMILQSIAVPIVLLTLAFADASPGTPARLLILITVWTTVAATLASLIPYAQRAAAQAGRVTGTIAGPNTGSATKEDTP